VEEAQIERAEKSAGLIQPLELKSPVRSLRQPRAGQCGTEPVPRHRIDEKLRCRRQGDFVVVPAACRAHLEGETCVWQRTESDWGAPVAAKVAGVEQRTRRGGIDAERLRSRCVAANSSGSIEAAGASPSPRRTGASVACSRYSAVPPSGSRSASRNSQNRWCQRRRRSVAQRLAASQGVHHIDIHRPTLAEW
jgi:hypothetical protein